MRRALAVAAVLTVALTGCSQIAAIAPVGGSRTATVRYAGNDVLIEKGVEILTAPVCTQTGKVVSCVGSTVGGDEIRFASDEATPVSVTVTVGTEVLYSGLVTDVIDASIGGGS